MFKKTAIFLFTIVVLVVCLSSCDKGLTVNEKALLEYPVFIFFFSPYQKICGLCLFYHQRCHAHHIIFIVLLFY